MSLRVRASFRDIKAELSLRIATRIWAPGALIPGEEQLAREFGSARATVNRALQELARAGMVERKRKSGTRVALHPVREARFVIPLVRREVEATGAAYVYARLSREEAGAPPEIAKRLGLADGAAMLHVRCLHRADGAPWQYEDRWINLEAVPAAADESFETVGPNEWLVEHAPFSRAEFSFGAARAGHEDLSLLALRDGDAVFVAERTTYLGARPVTFVRLAHPPSYRIVTEI